MSAVFHSRAGFTLVFKLTGFFSVARETVPSFLSYNPKRNKLFQYGVKKFSIMNKESNNYHCCLHHSKLNALISDIQCSNLYNSLA